MRQNLHTVAEVGRHVLDAAHLPADMDATCRDALGRPGRLFSPTPLWARLFLAWVDALDEPLDATFLPGAVACECMIAGYDLIDAAYDQAYTSDPHSLHAQVLSSGIILLHIAQELLAQLDVPGLRRAHAATALARAGRRALVAQQQDVSLRQDLTLPSEGVVLTVLRRRSGTLVAVPCQCAALLTGAPWRIVALAGRFGQALGCAVQLEDDLADRPVDECSGRKTIPVLLAEQTPDLVDTITWVLIRRFQHEAAQALMRLPLAPPRTEALWTLLPPDLRTI